MPTQSNKQVLGKGFGEERKGYRKEDAIAEAKRCLQCENPSCLKGCPAGVDCKAFIKTIAGGSADLALEKINERNPFPHITSRVCPVRRQCEGNCVLAKAGKAIDISGLEMFAAEHGKAKEKKIALNGKKAAVVGSGPAGMAAAIELAERGFKVKVFESEKNAGGIPFWGIPDYKLPKEIVEKEAEKARKKGVEFILGKTVGKDTMLSDLQREFDAVVICTGEHGKLLGLKGEEIDGVLCWDSFLKKFNGSMETLKGKKAVIIGGGDTAMDCARIAARLGMETKVAYRKTMEFMPCQKEERAAVEADGVSFDFLLSPIEFSGKEKLEKVRFQKIKIEKEQFISTQETAELPADFAIIAAGQEADRTVLNGTELYGRGIETHSAAVVGLERAFAAGDIVNEKKTVAHCIASARKAVGEIVGSAVA